MPNIPQYNAPVGLVPQPTDMAAATAREAGTLENRFARETGEAIGGAISRVGGQIGQEIDQHMAAAAISHGASSYSQLYGDLTQQWNQVAAQSDPNDTSVMQGFKEKVLQPSIEKFQQAFEGAPEAAQRWAQQRVEGMQQHFTEKMTADMGTRAAAAVQQNLDTMQRNYTLAALADPTTLDHIVDSVNSSVKGIVETHPYLSAGQAARVQAEVVPKMLHDIAKAAFGGEANASPESADISLKSGRYDKFFDAEDKQRAEDYATKVQEQRDQDAKRNASNLDHEKRQASQDRQGEYFAKLYDPTTFRVIRPTGRLGQQIMNDPTMTPRDKAETLRFFQAEYHRQVQEDKANAAGPPVRDDQAAVLAAKARIGAADNPLTKEQIVDGLDAGHFTVKTAHDLVWRVSQAGADQEGFNKAYNNAFGAIRHAFTSDPMYIGRPEVAADALNRIDFAAQKTIRAAQAAHLDPTPLLDPTNKDYVFAPGKIKAYITPPQQVIKDQANAIKAGQKPPTQQGTAPNQPGFPAVPAAALQYLKSHPETKEQFKAHFGFLPDEK
jgi:hypothetical protein